MHFFLASMSGAPEFRLSGQEAKEMADAISEVSSYYTSALDPKTLAILDCTTIVGGIYAAHIGAFVARKIKEGMRSQTPAPVRQPQQQSDNVEPIRPARVSENFA